MRAGVTVSANQCRTRQRETQLRADHMNDAVPVIIGRDVCEIMTICILDKTFNLPARQSFGKSRGVTLGRHRMVSDSKVGAGTFDGCVSGVKRGKGLRAGNLLHQVPVYIKKRFTIIIGEHRVAIPDLVVKGTRTHRSHPAFQTVFIRVERAAQGFMVAPSRWLLHRRQMIEAHRSAHFFS